MLLFLGNEVAFHLLSFLATLLGALIISSFLFLLVPFPSLRPLNWESISDLLEAYAQMDEESLGEAHRR